MNTYTKRGSTAPARLDEQIVLRLFGDGELRPATVVACVEAPDEVLDLFGGHLDVLLRIYKDNT